MALLARLKPYNPKKRHLVRCYMIDGVRFYEERGWYEVSDSLADKLRDLHQDHYDLDSPLLFDIMTPEQAEQLEQAELDREANAKATARRPATPVNTRPQRAARVAEETGDLTSAEVVGKPAVPAMIDPDPEGEELLENEDEGRIVEVGRVVKKEPDAPRTRGRSKAK